MVSVTVYYGEQKWDGPMSLKEILVEMPEEIERIVSDYKLISMIGMITDSPELIRQGENKEVQICAQRLRN